MSGKDYLSSLLTGSKTTAIEQLKNNPDLCECARIYSRPLNSGKSTLLNSMTRDSAVLDSWNLKASHEHIAWDQTEDNIGFRGAGQDLGIWPLKAKGELFSEKFDNKNYTMSDSLCYDGQLMREAVVSTGQPATYRIFGFNCQEYIQRVKDHYQSLLKRF